MSNFTSKLNSGWLQIIVLVALLVAMNIGIKELTNKGVAGAEILLLRSICNLVAAFFIAGFSRTSIIPKQPKLQVGAFICLGLGLLLIFTAYQYISAGSVSTLQRLDIPLLVLIVALGGQTKLSQIIWAVFAFVLVATLLVLNKTTHENPMGYFIVLLAVVIVCINTLLQKKIAVTENIQTIIFISSLSAVFWGGIRCWQTHSTFSNITVWTFVVIIGLSIVNLIIFLNLHNFTPKIQ